MSVTKTTMNEAASLPDVWAEALASPPMPVPKHKSVSKRRGNRPVDAGREPLPPATKKVIGQCRAYVEKCRPAVSGRGGHNQTFAVARIIFHDFGLDEESGWEILCDYNERCEPAWSERELRHKMEDGIRLPSTGGKPRGWMRNADAAYGEGELNPVNGKYVLSSLRTRPIARCFIEANFRQAGTILLRYYGNLYLRWMDNGYREIDETELKDMILRFLTESTCTKEGNRYSDFPAHERLVKDVLAAVKGLVRISKKTRLNSWIGEGEAPCDSTDLIFGPTRT